ncbi:MAG: DegT/DnrJ/EryC1/StrS family aminotransferase [Anaerolineae bacterium]|nr:DegT/DnrJ/EryC1/StrS family aminotransferase [Anaerolineae bacterium]
MTEIPIFDTTDEVNALWNELNSAFQQTMRDGRFIMGEAVPRFEQEVASYLGVRHAVALNSGTDALMIGLRALGISLGDEVITSSFTFFATTEGISALGGVPVFVDIDPRTFTLDVTRLESTITPRTKAIIPVHLFGHPVEMDAVLDLSKKYGIPILEDVAQAFGATYRGRKVGSLGICGALSFFPSKNLGAYGDGGMLVTNDDHVAETARMLRVHGAKKKYYNEVLGYNSRLDTLQAALLRVKLPYVDTWNQQRREVAARYTDMLSDVRGLTLPTVPAHMQHVFHQYTVRVENGLRDELQHRLKEQGIGTMVYYPVPVHQLPIYQHLNVQLPICERTASEVLSLPMWPQLSIEKQVRVVEAVKEVMKQAQV